MHRIILRTILLTTLMLTMASAEIPHPDDAPKAMSPVESAKAFRVPAIG